MKHIFIFIMLLGSTLSMGQDFSANWTGHYSYLNVRSISEGNNKFVVAVQNAYFEYDPALNRSKVFTTIEGLNGREIANVYYSKEFKQALIGYENGLLQLKRDNRDDFQNFPEIVNRVSISPDVKNINHFYEFGDLAYISTDFGVVEFNLRRREFGNTFFIGNAGLNVKVNQTVVYNGVIYALTTNGIRFASVDNLNLIDFSVWNNLGNTSTNYTHAVVFNNKLYLVNEANQLFVLIGNNLDLELFYDEPVSDVKVSNEKLLVITKGNVFAYDEDLNEDLLFFGFSDQIADLSTASLLGDALYLGDQNLGFVSLSVSNPSTVFSLSPDGPILNNVFNLRTSFNQVWVLYGEYTQFFNPFPLNTRGVSVLTNQSWTNITPTELFNARVIVDATVDPTNPSRVFLSSYYDGILVMQDKRIQRVLNGNNSGIEGISNVLDNRIGTIEYTPNGDFYFTNSLSLHPLKRKKPTGEIENIDLSGAFNNPQGSSVAKLAIDRQGNVYMASFSAGIIAYQPSSDRAARISSEITGVNFPSVSNPNPIMTALAVDETNRLWIGTNRGLRVMFNPSSIFDPNTPINVSPIIIVEDDGVAQELLFEQSITDIQVDGANNKWIATADSGVFQVSPNGQEVLNHFTRNNSPLPSNNVTSIAINGDTGEVYFGTANGLISYQSRITNAEEDLANVRVFPNPVRPKFTGAVTIDGLTQNANVKITDITGSLVFEENARGGSVQWDTTAFGKYKVSSGVYLVLITGSEGTKTKVKKIMVVR